MDEIIDIDPDHQDLYKLLLKANQVQTSQLRIVYKQIVCSITKKLEQT